MTKPKHEDALNNRDKRNGEMQLAYRLMHLFRSSTL
jgi:hypothetical protein